MEPVPPAPEPVEVLTFTLYRWRDNTGVSGTGPVADGAVWPNGHTHMVWRGDMPTAVTASNWRLIERVHCHGGASEIQWHGAKPADA